MLRCNIYHTFCEPILAKSSRFEHTGTSPRGHGSWGPLESQDQFLSLVRTGGWRRSQALSLSPGVLFPYCSPCKELPFARDWLSKNPHHQSGRKLEQRAETWTLHFSCGPWVRVSGHPDGDVGLQGGVSVCACAWVWRILRQEWAGDEDHHHVCRTIMGASWRK